MKTVTLEELREYIFAQPNDREVKMWQAYKSNPCGCAMVHYGKDNGFDFDYTNLLKGWQGEDQTEILVALEDVSKYPIRNDTQWHANETIQQEAKTWWDVLIGRDKMNKLAEVRTYKDLKELLRWSKEEILNEVASFYNSNNRGYCSADGCTYLTSEGNRCAVGHFMSKKNAEIASGFGGSVKTLDSILRQSGMGYSSFNDLLLPHVRGYDVDFWLDLQNLHDIDRNWDENGLTENGESMKRKIYFQFCKEV